MYLCYSLYISCIEGVLFRSHPCMSFSTPMKSPRPPQHVWNWHGYHQSSYVCNTYKFEFNIYLLMNYIVVGSNYKKNSYFLYLTTCFYAFKIFHEFACDKHAYKISMVDNLNSVVWKFSYFSPIQNVNVTSYKMLNIMDGIIVFINNFAPWMFDKLIEI